MHRADVLQHLWRCVGTIERNVLLVSTLGAGSEGHIALIRASASSAGGPRELAIGPRLSCTKIRMSGERRHTQVKYAVFV